MEPKELKQMLAYGKEYFKEIKSELPEVVELLKEAGNEFYPIVESLSNKILDLKLQMLERVLTTKYTKGNNPNLIGYSINQAINIVNSIQDDVNIAIKNIKNNG